MLIIGLVLYVPIPWAQKLLRSAQLKGPFDGRSISNTVARGRTAISCYKMA